MPQLLLFIRSSSFGLDRQPMYSLQVISFAENIRESQTADVDFSLLPMKKWRSWIWEVGNFSKQPKARGFKVVFRMTNFSNLTKVFVWVIVFPLNLVLTVSFTFFVSKLAELLWRSLFTFWMTHKTRHFSDGGLFAQISLRILLSERLDLSCRCYISMILLTKLDRLQ